MMLSSSSLNSVPPLNSRQRYATGHHDVYQSFIIQGVTENVQIQSSQTVIHVHHVAMRQKTKKEMFSLQHVIHLSYFSVYAVVECTCLK